MTPLNIYPRQATDADRGTCREYGQAISELAIANIFPGDMLWKNFGVTRYGRVVFYDYDEIEYMTDCNFRKIPPAPTQGPRCPASLVQRRARWTSSLGREFATFLLGQPKIRKPAFLQHHQDPAARPEVLADAQARDPPSGCVEDFYPRQRLAPALRF